MKEGDKNWLEPFQHVMPDLAAKYVQSEVLGGIDSRNIPVGKTLIVVTNNFTYRIERREEGENGFFISGNPKDFPEPTRINIHGSTFRGSSLKPYFVGRDMHMEGAIFQNASSTPTAMYLTGVIKNLYYEDEKSKTSPEDRP